MAGGRWGHCLRGHERKWGWGNSWRGEGAYYNHYKGVKTTYARKWGAVALQNENSKVGIEKSRWGTNYVYRKHAVKRQCVELIGDSSWAGRLRRGTNVLSSWFIV